MMLRCALLAHWQKTKIAGSLRRASHTITIWKFHGPNTQKTLGGVGPRNRHSTEPSHSEWSISITASVLTHHGLTLNHLRNARLSHVSLTQEMSNPSILSHPFGWQSIGRLSLVFSYLTYLNITFRVYLTFCDLPHAKRGVRFVGVRKRAKCRSRFERRKPGELLPENQYMRHHVTSCGTE